MQRHFLMFASSIALAFSLNVAQADHHHDLPGADWIAKADLMKKMEGQGYTSVVAEADDGHWEGEAVKDGQIVKFHANAQTGDITMLRPKGAD